MAASDSFSMQRNLEVECFVVKMTVLVPSERPDIRAILMLADENGERLDADILMTKFFPGLNHAIGKNIIRRYMEMGLLDNSGRLTESARLSMELEKNRVLIPESGDYKIWVTEDTLVPQRILRLNRISEVELNEFEYRPKQAGGQKSSEVIYRPEKLPEWLTFDRVSTFMVLFEGEILPIAVSELETKGFYVKENDKHFEGYSPRLIMKINSGHSVTVEVRDDIMSSALEIESEVESEDLWNQVVDEFALEWEGGILSSGFAKFDFDKLDQRGKDSFLVSVSSRDIALHTLGKFTSSEIELNAQPATQDDADRWGKYSLENSINDYVNEQEFEEIKRLVRSKFANLIPEELPSLRDLVEEFKQTGMEGGEYDKRYWYLMAPIDLKYGGP